MQLALPLPIILLRRKQNRCLCLCQTIREKIPLANLAKIGQPIGEDIYKTHFPIKTTLHKNIYRLFFGNFGTLANWYISILLVHTYI